MKIYKITNDNYFNILESIIKNKEESIAWGVATDNVIVTGRNAINEEYCKENNLDVYYSTNEGGTIVLSSGDVEFNIFRYGGWKDGENIINKILEYLKTRIENISLQGNDLLVDNKYKVGSYSSKNTGNEFLYTGIHLSVNVDLEMIKNICLKPMNKIPRGLSEYGVTTGEMVELIKNISIYL
jgi:hypothetical protein